jgi:hypothetical protein
MLGHERVTDMIVLMGYYCGGLPDDELLLP